MGKSKSLLLSNLIYILAGLGLTEAKGKEVKCICKDENGKVAKVQMLPWPFTSCISFLWLGDLQQQKLILSQFWILEGQHQFHGVKTPLPGVGWAELPLVAAGIPLLVATSLQPLPVFTSPSPLHVHLLFLCLALILTHVVALTALLDNPE